MARRSRLVPILTLLAVFALSACAQRIGLPATPGNDTASGGQPTPTFSQFSDIPIPTGAAMNMERTLVLGSKESWVGRLVLSSSHNAVDMFAFFKQRAGEFGWQEITSVRSSISVLTFSRGDRVMTVQIQGKAISGSDMDITVAPRESHSLAQGSGNSPSVSPPPNRAPVQRIQ